MQDGTGNRGSASRSSGRALGLAVVAAAGGLGLVAASGTLSGATEQTVTDGSVAFAAASGAFGGAILAALGWWILSRTRLRIPVDLLTTLVVAGAVGALTGIANTQAPLPTATGDDSTVTVGAQTAADTSTARNLPPEDRDRRIQFDDQLGGTITLAVGFAMLVGAAVFFGRRSELRERERSAVYLRSELTIDEPDDAPAEALAAALRTSLASLRASGDPRAAIRAAYGTLLDGLAEIGLPRRRHEAPVGYIRRCLTSRSLPDTPIAELLDLFQLARFSDHPITADHAARAERALEHAIDHMRIRA
ncbi:MAG: DUF4129 domain-containing protein [Ilumatobacter sp.]|uniref:DUF4129 domain-containing protein n=1 Tax=Ilumatobacter sp. TaxID=1967498 RepID=UPI00260DBCD2|nr:DUF4129 domain-containing protein [Ilumatobacter sp.]MDJ0769162.1 DUF4129 domain-containing protein [Ilumatobacter sp.]